MSSADIAQPRDDNGGSGTDQLNEKLKSIAPDGPTIGTTASSNPPTKATTAASTASTSEQILQPQPQQQPIITTAVPVPIDTTSNNPVCSSSSSCSHNCTYSRNDAEPVEPTLSYNSTIIQQGEDKERTRTLDSQIVNPQNQEVLQGQLQVQDIGEKGIIPQQQLPPAQQQADDNTVQQTSHNLNAAESRYDQQQAQAQVQVEVQQQDQRTLPEDMPKAVIGHREMENVMPVMNTITGRSSQPNMAVHSYAQLNQGEMEMPQVMRPMFQQQPGMGPGVHGVNSLGVNALPPNEDQEMFTLRLRHQKVLYWTGAIWHEYRDVRKLKLIRPPREVSIPDPSTLVGQGVVSPTMVQLPPSSVRYIRSTTSFKGQVSQQKILSRRSTHDSEDDINIWPEVYFVNEAWYYYQPQNTVIMLDENWKGETIEVCFPLIQCDRCKDYATPQKKFQEHMVGNKKKHFCSLECFHSLTTNPPHHPQAIAQSPIQPSSKMHTPHHSQHQPQQMWTSQAAHMSRNSLVPPMIPVSHAMIPPQMRAPPMRMPLNMMPGPMYYTPNAYQLIPAQQNEEMAAQQLVGLSGDAQRVRGGEPLEYQTEAGRKRTGSRFLDAEPPYSKRSAPAMVPQQMPGIPTMLVMDPESQVQQNLQAPPSPSFLPYYTPQQSEYQTFSPFIDQSIFTHLPPPPPSLSLEGTSSPDLSQQE
ncbi:hypothetical protein Pelo_13306 [Pelomyxa schiedti]|nr:hypothetical protein Pelo_13306 [Pelomyxa schiedti]